MLEGRGNAKHIVCPLHRWTYELDGKLLGAPHFPQNPCLHLTKAPLQRWNGLLFASGRDILKDLANVSVMKDLDFSGYMLDRVESKNTTSLENLYRGVSRGLPRRPFHPGLSQFVNCDDLKWDFGDCTACRQ